MKRRIRDGRFVCAILLTFCPSEGNLSENSIRQIVDRIFSVNYGRVALMLLSAMGDYNIAYNDVLGFATINANVMLTFFSKVLSFPKLRRGDRNLIPTSAGAGQNSRF